MNSRHPALLVVPALLACTALACGRGSPSSASLYPSGSEVSVSAVSGALNTASGSAVAWAPKAPKTGVVDRALAFLNPIGTAYAATWSCSGQTLTPAFDGSAGNPYAFTPPSCSVTWRDDKTATSKWSGPFTLNYGSSCDSAHPFQEEQTAGCEVVRTTSDGGDARTITGPDGNTYAIQHNTNGEGTGWDSAVVPVPNDSGVELACDAAGCSSRTLVINGSHLTGTVDLDGIEAKIWDHTVTGALTVTGLGTSRVVTGSVTVQHNIIKVTSTTTFSSVGYGDPTCCFPTEGSVTTTFSKGSDVGKTEKISFSASCGETTLNRADGTSDALTLAHCL